MILISGSPGIVDKGHCAREREGDLPRRRPSQRRPARGSDLAYNPRFITPMPAYGVFAGHVNGRELRDVKLSFDGAEQRPAVIARDVDGLLFEKLNAQKGTGPTLEHDG